MKQKTFGFNFRIISLGSKFSEEYFITSEIYTCTQGQNWQQPENHVSIYMPNMEAKGFLSYFKIDKIFVDKSS